MPKSAFFARPEVTAWTPLGPKTPANFGLDRIIAIVESCVALPQQTAEVAIEIMQNGSHWGPIGHRLAAETVLRYLVKRGGLVPRVDAP